MGSGFNFVTKVARKQTKQQLQNQLTASLSNTVVDCQLGQLNYNGDGTYTANMPDGSQAQVVPQGTPGPYSVICNSVAYAPEATFISTDGRQTAYIAGTRAVVDGDPDWYNTYAFKTIYSLYDQNPWIVYIREVGSSQLYLIDVSQFNPRCNPEDFEVQFAADGQAYCCINTYQNYDLILGPFQFQSSCTPQFVSNPTGTSPNQQTIQIALASTNTLVDDYHTNTQYQVGVGFTLVGNATADYLVQNQNTQFNTLDLNEECNNKIQAPQQMEPGSASIYKQYLGDFDIDNAVQPGFAGRFFPIVNANYTYTNMDYNFCGGVLGCDDDSLCTGQCPFTEEDLHGDGQDTVNWKSDGITLASFTNVLMAFNIDATTLVEGGGQNPNYVLDLVADITYYTAFIIESDLATGEDFATLNLDIPAGGANGLGQNYTAITSCTRTLGQTYSYSLPGFESDVAPYPLTYPYVPPFFVQSGPNGGQYITAYIGDMDTNVTAFTNQWQVNSLGQGGCAEDACQNDGSLDCYSFVTGSQVITLTNVNPSCTAYIPTGSTGPDVGCGNQFAATGTDVDGDCDPCAAPLGPSTETQNCFDGTQVTLDGSVPAVTSFAQFTLSPQVNCAGFGILFSSYNVQYYNTTDGSILPQRFGRGVASFNSVITVNASSFDTSKYSGPSITVSYLKSAYDSNFMAQAFRSTTGGQACVFEDYNPNPGTDSYTVNQQYADSVDNSPVGQSLISELEGDGVNLTAAQDSQYLALFSNDAFNGTPTISTDVNEGTFGNGLSGNNANNGIFYYAVPYSGLGQYGTTAPPDIFTDTVLAPFRTFPFQDNIYLEAFDSYWIEGYNISTSTATGAGAGGQVETISVYQVNSEDSDNPGATFQIKNSTGSALIQNEQVLSFIMPLTISASGATG